MKLLLQKTDLTLAGTVTMDDLEKVVGMESIIADNSAMNNPSSTLAAMNSADGNEEQGIVSGVTTSSLLAGEFIAASFEDGFFIGEILEIIDKDTVHVDYKLR